MKRLFISILTICCLISSISAGSLLLTPHHATIHAHIQSISDKGNEDSFSVPIHVDAEGENEVIHIIRSFTLKSNSNLNKKNFENIFNSPPLSIQHIGILPAKGCKIFQVLHIRILIFPFHSFW